MRVVIVCDMEGTAQIEGYTETVPIYPEYWRSGRQKLTSDVVAAALGLIDGGASEVAVINHHGAGETGWPNIIVEALPPGVTYAEDWNEQHLPEHADAMFQVGCHARGGSPSFFSHTILPGLRLRLTGELLSESHWWALTGSAPVLGIVGSEALGADLGFLSGVPFLAVQGGTDRMTPKPLFGSQAASVAAIRTFARTAIGEAGMQAPFAPRDFVLELSIQNGDDAARALEAAGWTRTSRTEFRIEAPTWRGEGEPVIAAIEAAIGAAWEPYSAAFAGLDASSESSSLAYARDAFAASDRIGRALVADRTVEWITPESAARWEGLETGQT